RLAALADAVRYSKTLKGPRRLLLVDAMQHDEPAQAVYWAKEVLRLEPSSADAHYVMTAEALDGPSPNLPEIKRGLVALEAAAPPPVRIAWIKARLAQLTNDSSTLQSTLTQARTLELPDDTGPVDRSALLRLRAIDAETTTDLARLPERV